VTRTVGFREDDNNRAGKKLHRSMCAKRSSDSTISARRMARVQGCRTFGNSRFSNVVPQCSPGANVMTAHSIGPIKYTPASRINRQSTRCLPGFVVWAWENRGAAGSRQQRYSKWETGDGLPLFEDGVSQSPLGRKHPSVIGLTRRIAPVLGATDTNESLHNAQALVSPR